MAQSAIMANAGRESALTREREARKFLPEPKVNVWKILLSREEAHRSRGGNVEEADRPRCRDPYEDDSEDDVPLQTADEKTAVAASPEEEGDIAYLRTKWAKFNYIADMPPPPPPPSSGSKSSPPPPSLGSKSKAKAKPKTANDSRPPIPRQPIQRDKRPIEAVDKVQKAKQRQTKKAPRHEEDEEETSNAEEARNEEETRNAEEVRHDRSRGGRPRTICGWDKTNTEDSQSRSNVLTFMNESQRVASAPMRMAHCGHEEPPEGMRRRAAIGRRETHELVNTRQPRTRPEPPEPDEPPPGYLPDCVGVCNLQIANWMIGEGCDTKQLLDMLAWTPFDLIVMVETSAVAGNHKTREALMELYNRDQNSSNRVMRVMEEKLVIHILEKVWVVVHKGKVDKLHYRSWRLDSDGEVKFVTLMMEMNKTRQRMAECRVGVIDARDVTKAIDIQRLASLTITERVAMVTGYMSRRKDFMEAFADCTHAVYQCPVYQDLCVWSSRSRGYEVRFHPGYFLFYGNYKEVDYVHTAPMAPRDWEIGADILADLVPLSELPQWANNVEGSAFVPKLGTIKMKEVPWEKWRHHVFQTALWIGTATPGRGSKRRHAGTRVTKSAVAAPDHQDQDGDE